MKKVMIMTVVLLAVSVISAGAQDMQSQSSSKTADTTANHFSGGYGQNFVDKNNDGICDHLQSGTVVGHGPNFIDANNNGICDHRENGSGCKMKQRRARNGNVNCMRQSNRKRHCRNINNPGCPMNSK